MTFDGPVEDYLPSCEAPMMGHNGPPLVAKLTDSIILALMRAVMRRRDLGSLDKAVRWATLLSLDEDGVSMTSVKKLSEAVGHGRQASVRQARDRMVGDGFQEVIGPRSVRGVKVSLEDEITTYCDKVRPSSDCTTSPGSDRTRLPGSNRTRSGLPSSDRTRLPGSNGTTSSRTRVSYTEENNTPYSPPKPKRAAARSVEPDRFDEFWVLYPRKVGKGQARKAWAKALKITTADVIIQALDRQVPDLRGKCEFCPHPSTWLNGERWTDEPAKSGINGKHQVDLDQYFDEAEKREEEARKERERYEEYQRLAERSRPQHKR